MKKKYILWFILIAIQITLLVLLNYGIYEAFPYLTKIKSFPDPNVPLQNLNPLITYFILQGLYLWALISITYYEVDRKFDANN